MNTRADLEKSMFKWLLNEGLNAPDVFFFLLQLAKINARKANVLAAPD